MPLEVPALMQSAPLMHQLLVEPSVQGNEHPANAVGHNEEVSRERQGITSNPASVRAPECNGIAK